MVAEFLALVDVGEVNLHHRNVEKKQRVEDRHRGVGERGGIDDQGVRLGPGLLNPADQFPFVIGLPEGEAPAARLCRGRAGSLDIGQGLAAIV